jgi:hypothetical protein
MRMHSFRARIERGRIIVHEPIDLPDGVIFLVPIEAPASARNAQTLPPPVDAPHTNVVEQPPADQRSSS